MRTSPTVLVDAAHNPAGMTATVEAIKESFDFTRLVGVVGVVSGKDVHGMLTALEDVCAELVVTQNSSPRAMPADELGALAVDVFGADRVSVCPRLGDAISEAIELAEAGPDDALGGSAVLVTGSVITAGRPAPCSAGGGHDGARPGPGGTGARRRRGRGAAHRGHRRAVRPARDRAERAGADRRAAVVLLALAVVLILAAGLQRRPQGVVIGTVCRFRCCSPACSTA